MNPYPAILSSQATANLSISIPRLNNNNIVRGRSTLAKGGARLGLGEAHVKKATPTRDIKGKRVVMLSSSSFEERETHKLNSHSPSPSPSPSTFVGEMGRKDDHQNDAALRLNGNGVVSRKAPPKLLTLPTVLTLARVAAVPLFISTYYSNSWWGAAATTSIFVGAAITDWLDGYLARKMSQGTAFGAFLDPVADKLMVAATLVLLCSRPPENALYGNYPWLLPVPAIAIIGREITMSAVREWAASQDAKLLQAVAVNNLGKWKTATQMTALTIILATRDSSVSSQGALATSGVSLLYISAGLAMWSLIVYMRKIWKVLLR